MLQESDATRKKRILGNLIYQFLCVSFTLSMYSFDSFVFFSTNLGSVILRSESGNKDNINRSVSFGPLFTRICPSNSLNHSLAIDDFKKNNCSQVLFYQAQEYITQEGMAKIMISSWIPLVLGLVISRLTFWRIHSLLQMAVSISYGSLVYFLLSDGYKIGNGIYVLVARLTMTAIFFLIVLCIMLIKYIRSKYYSEESMPILVGVPFKEHSDDPLSESYWEPVQEEYSMSEDD